MVAKGAVFCNVQGWAKVFNKKRRPDSAHAMIDVCMLCAGAGPSGAATPVGAGLLATPAGLGGIALPADAAALAEALAATRAELDTTRADASATVSQVCSGALGFAGLMRFWCWEEAAACLC